MELAIYCIICGEKLKNCGYHNIFYARIAQSLR